MWDKKAIALAEKRPCCGARRGGGWAKPKGVRLEDLVGVSKSGFYAERDGACYDTVGFKVVRDLGNGVFASCWAGGNQPQTMLNYVVGFVTTAPKGTQGIFVQDLARNASLQADGKLGHVEHPNAILKVYYVKPKGGKINPDSVFVRDVVYQELPDNPKKPVFQEDWRVVPKNELELAFGDSCIDVKYRGYYLIEFKTCGATVMNGLPDNIRVTIDKVAQTFKVEERV